MQHACRSETSDRSSANSCGSPTSRGGRVHDWIGLLLLTQRSYLQTARGISAFPANHQRSTANSRIVPKPMIIDGSASGDNVKCPFESSLHRAPCGAEFVGRNVAAKGCVFGTKALDLAAESGSWAVLRRDADCSCCSSGILRDSGSFEEDHSRGDAEAAPRATLGWEGLLWSSSFSCWSTSRKSGCRPVADALVDCVSLAQRDLSVAADQPRGATSKGA